MGHKEILYGSQRDPIWVTKRSYLDHKEILYGSQRNPIWVTKEPQRDKTCHRGLRPGLTHTGLYTATASR